jgi:sugar lactone lactonase YvrE
MRTRKKKSTMKQKEQKVKQFIVFLCVLTGMMTCACSHTDTQPESVEGVADTLEIVAQLDTGPGNINVTPTGKIVVSLHQFYGHDVRVASIDDNDRLMPFATTANVNSVLGLQADAEDVVWLLDNAMRGGTTRRLVAWDASEERLVADIDLTKVTTDQSFLNDLAVDPVRNTVYIADPAGGADAAIIVVDVVRGAARRVLQGHKSVIPEDMDLVIDGNPVRILADDGTEIRPRVGINPIALDKDGEWLFYGPMHGRSMYRIRTADLRNVGLAPDDLAIRAERWSEKPICDGISIDNAGNVYLGDLAKNAIGVIGSDRKYSVLISDPRLSWVDAFSFGDNGYLYAVVNQLHRSAVLNGGESATQPPYLIVKFRPLSKGTVGR